MLCKYLQLIFRSFAFDFKLIKIVFENIFHDFSRVAKNTLNLFFYALSNEKSSSFRQNFNDNSEFHQNFDLNLKTQRKIDENDFESKKKWTNEINMIWKIRYHNQNNFNVKFFFASVFRINYRKHVTRISRKREFENYFSLFLSFFFFKIDFFLQFHWFSSSFFFHVKFLHSILNIVTFITQISYINKIIDFIMSRKVLFDKRMKWKKKAKMKQKVFFLFAADRFVK